MPIYEYECDDCKQWTEVLASVADMAREVVCSSCEGVAYRRIKTVPCVSIEPIHQACGSLSKYHGVKNPRTGEGIKPKK